MQNGYGLWGTEVIYFSHVAYLHAIWLWPCNECTRTPHILLTYYISMLRKYTLLRTILQSGFVFYGIFIIVNTSQSQSFFDFDHFSILLSLISDNCSWATMADGKRKILSSSGTIGLYGCMEDWYIGLARGWNVRSFRTSLDSYGHVGSHNHVTSPFPWTVASGRAGTGVHRVRG